MVTGALVIGGGFAGVAAACRLAGDGHRPLLLERAPRLGGRAASIVLKAQGETIDAGQHVLMRCCTASTGFLLRIGASDAVRFQPALSIPIVSPTGRATLRSAPLPGILHLAPSLLRYRLLSWQDRLAAMRAGLALSIGQMDPEVRFGSWLADRRQSDRAIDLLWDPICVAALNARARDVAIHAAGQVFRDAFFRPAAADLGFFAGPLSDVFDAASRYIEGRGGRVLTSSDVKALKFERGRVRGVELDTGETLDTDAAICAVPPADLRRLVGSDRRLKALTESAERLWWAPIVDLHVWFDRPVLDVPFVVAVDSPVQAVFDVTRLHGRMAPPTHLVLSQSAADEWIDRPIAEVTQRLLDGLGTLFPEARDAGCLRSLVVRHRNATFVRDPVADRLRPRPVTAIGGLYLAGDWTSTGWPSTIEGAIRSGIAAAAHVERQREPDEPIGGPRERPPA